MSNTIKNIKSKFLSGSERTVLKEEQFGSLYSNKLEEFKEECFVKFDTEVLPA